MNATESLDPVQAQYERWVYPPRVHDLAAVSFDSPHMHFHDLRKLHWLYWPKAPYRDDLEILVAGCGSLSAAAQAYLYPQARVVGIDVSHASLSHEEFLQRKHNLTNLTLRHLRLEEVAALNASFDFIICYGVLHHLADAEAGLRALGQVLRQDGVIDIMVYGKYGRVGVTLLQEMFRVMGLQQDEAGVQVVKEVLAALPPHHPVQKYLRLAANDLASDEGLVDTFLHRRDRPFSCGECLDLVRDAGLVFQGWKENGLYHLDCRMSLREPVRPNLERLGQRELWEAVEMLDTSIAGHWFHACRPERAAENYVIQFEDDAFLDYIPVARVTQTAAADLPNGKPALIARPPFPAMGLDQRQTAVFRLFDAARSVRQCLAGAGIPVDDPATIPWARRFFSGLWRTGYAMFRLP